MHHPPPPLTFMESLSAVTIGLSVLGLSIRIMFEDWRHARARRRALDLPRGRTA